MLVLGAELLRNACLWRVHRPAGASTAGTGSTVVRRPVCGPAGGIAQRRLGGFRRSGPRDPPRSAACSARVDDPPPTDDGEVVASSNLRSGFRPSHASMWETVRAPPRDALTLSGSARSSEGPRPFDVPGPDRRAIARRCSTLAVCSLHGEQRCCFCWRKRRRRPLCSALPAT